MPNLTLTKQVNWYCWWLRNFPLSEVEIVEYKDGLAHLHIHNIESHILRQRHRVWITLAAHFKDNGL